MRDEDPGLWTLLCSRIGFNGKKIGGFMTEYHRGGIRCRWPRTLDASLDLLYSLRNKITVMTDPFETLAAFDTEDSYAFVDPPYTVTKTCPGHAQYEEAVIDHANLVSRLASWRGRWQLTYNLSPLPIIPSLYQLKLEGRAEIDFPEMLSGHGNGGSGKKWEMLVSKTSDEHVPLPERMEAMVMTAEWHRHLLRLCMSNQRSKRLGAENTRYALAVLRKEFTMNDGVVLAPKYTEARNENQNLI